MTDMSSTPMSADGNLPAASDTGLCGQHARRGWLSQIGQPDWRIPMTKKINALLGSLLALTSAAAFAAPAFWTDWTAVTTAAPGAVGTLSVGASTVNVSYSGAYSFVTTGAGTNYWNPATPYTSAVVDNAPPASDIIALNAGGTKTISFSQAVQDPLIALVSWNGNTVDFGVPIEILSFGGGYWGSGPPVLNKAGTGFFGSGEVHGVIRLPGVHTSISFTDTSENWHGFTVGVVGLADEQAVPEPASLALIGLGLAALGGLRKRRTV